MLVVAIFTLSALASAATASDPVPLRSLTRDCRFTIGRLTFDLCPLFKSAQARKKTIEFERQTPPTVTKVVYDLSLDGPLKRDTTLPEHEQCAQGTWFCMTTINRRPDHRSEAPRILQLVPVVANFSEKDASSAAPASRFSVHAMLGEAHEKSPRAYYTLSALCAHALNASLANDPY
ncbi:hypothetical protein HETIRDRAFT_455887 [Heterobasidion irregulare TC 32-1]|uniref:Uncharacterized protein n=1 Tax=Heterobasidion irregulare (strain TC 32-1) TaxID=747525 RepID=W4JNU3_HETIT|nr:uncharacterized protein HETIRDRAFT_455887 [Heterobasidion irregulare TC 32-1]ETW75227.1 hypothetical protein HETIRDRAFT_455887 [Heterobasidion irregulare TC 32-1]